MMPIIQQILAEAGCADSPAVRQAVDEACYNQTSFVESVLDCEGVREREFLMALAHTLSLSWWEGTGDAPSEPGLRRHLPAEIALRHRLLPIALEERTGAAEGGKPLLHIATFDPLNLVTHQRVASSLSHPIVWHVGQRTRIVEGLQKLYGLGSLDLLVTTTLRIVYA